MNGLSFVTAKIDALPLQDQAGPVKVLLVDPDPSGIEKTRAAFGRYPSDFVLNVATSLGEARQEVMRQTPGLVIARANLPDGRGVDLLTDNQGRGYGVMILVPSGDQQAMVAAYNQGALDVLEYTSSELERLPQAAHASLRLWKQMMARQQAEYRLADEERRVRNVLDAVPGVVLVISRTGSILECRGMQRSLGEELTREVNGRPLMDAIDPDRSRTLASVLQQVQASQEFRSLVLPLSLNGEQHYMDVRIGPYTSSRLIAFLRDITGEQMIGTRLESLTEREREVLRLVASGTSNKQIASKLELSVKTVEAHRSRLMRKMGARNMAELMQLAMTVKDRL